MDPDPALVAASRRDRNDRRSSFGVRVISSSNWSTTTSSRSTRRASQARTSDSSSGISPLDQPLPRAAASVYRTASLASAFRAAPRAIAWLRKGYLPGRNTTVSHVPRDGDSRRNLGSSPAITTDDLPLPEAPTTATSGH